MTTDARDARELAEDGFHEIQLSGKQLVFLFMATTVVSIVIFLCGVLVGRGVRTPSLERTAAAAEAPATAVPPTDVDPGTPTKVDAKDLAYSDLNRQAPGAEPKPVDETPDDKAAPPAPAAQQKAEPAPAPAAPPVKAKEQAPAAPKPEATPAKTEPASLQPAPARAGAQVAGGFTIQVAALSERKEAEVIAKRLVSRGYSAFVLEPGTGAPAMYRVRVGSFKERREADKVARRLKQEEQLNPWVTR